MTSRNIFKFVVTLALVFAVAGACGIFTAKASTSSASSVRSLNLPPTASGKEVLNRSKFVFGESGAALAVGAFTLIDGTSLACPGPGTCTYASNEWLQLAASATSNWALVSELDGNFIGTGPFLGPIGTDFTAGSWSESSTHAAAGTHLIQTFGYMRDNTGTAFNYNFDYRVYKP
jgi:hypothetical protein